MKIVHKVSSFFCERSELRLLSYQHDDKWQLNFALYKIVFLKRFRQDFFKHCGRSVGEDVTVQFCGSGQILGLWWKREKTRWEKEGRKEALNLLHLENRSSSRESPSSLLFYESDPFHAYPIHAYRFMPTYSCPFFSYQVLFMPDPFHAC